MKNKITYILLLSVLLAGCAQTVSTYSLGSNDVLPKTTYTMYKFSSGSGERLRAVLLKHPESAVEIVPYSVQITMTKGTLDDAMHFLDRGLLYRHIAMLGVSYQGKTIGYLLIPERRMFSRDDIEIGLYEKNSKIYFTVYEKMYND